MTLPQVLKAGLVLLLLSIFLAQVLAPFVHRIRRYTARREDRPIARWRAILLVYLAMFGAAALVWLAAGSMATRWLPHAPAAFERMLAGSSRTGAEIERLVMRLPLPASIRRGSARGVGRFFTNLNRDARTSLHDVNRSLRYAWLLAIVPVFTFVLLNNAPAFRRSAVRVLPHGHLQWRAEEYLRDVNSALAGYLRAQIAAGLIVGVICVVGFSALSLPNAGTLGIAAGVMELVPVIGPLTVGIVAVGQAGRVAIVVVVFLVVLRLVQDYVVYPRLIRHGMHLSTIAVIVSVWIGAGLSGAIGVLLAIPAAGFLSVSVRHWREYRAIERLVRNAAADRHERT